jgi:DNA invertase Pin-like site-specific DNA recombinase
MARTVGLDRLIKMLADRITDGLADRVRSILEHEFRRMERRISGIRAPARARQGTRGRPAGRGRRGRVAASLAEVERRRARILTIVKANAEGISSVEVARRMRVDARSVGKLLSGLAGKKLVKKNGELFRPA